MTRPLAQVAIATFPDPDGLTAENGNTFQVSQASGNFVLQQAGVGAAGRDRPGQPRVIDRRSVVPAHRFDYQPERLLGVLKDHYDR